MPDLEPAESHHLEMVCTCSEEGAAAGAALYERVKEGLTRGSAELRPREVTDRSFVDDLLLSLSADFNATVREILYDQWAAVVVRSGPPGAEVQVVVACDEPTLGLAAIWEWFGARAARGDTP